MFGLWKGWTACNWLWKLWLGWQKYVIAGPFLFSQKLQRRTFLRV
jgi:hypothetical protein